MSKRHERQEVIFVLYRYLITKEPIEEIYEASEISNEVYETSKTIINDIDKLVESINPTLKEGWAFKLLNKVAQAILLNAHYEFITLKLDKSIIINEAVTIAKKFIPNEDYKFINASLDKLK